MICENSSCFTSFSWRLYLNQLRFDGMLCDFTVNIENKSWRVHRVILVSNSAFFVSQLSFAGSSHEVTLSSADVSADIFGQILDYFYCGTIDLLNNNLESVVTAAHFLQADNLITECVNFMIKSLNVRNVITIMRLAHKFELTEVLDQLLNYLLKSFDKFSNDESFILLPREYLSALLDSNQLLSANEATVLEALLLWQKHNGFQNADSIRLTLLPTALQTTAFNNMSVTAKSQYMDFMSRSERNEISSSELMCEEHKRQRYYSVNPIYVKGNISQRNYICRYTAESGKFAEALALVSLTRNSAFVSIENFGYLLGGRAPYFNSGCFTNFRRVNLNTSESENLRPLYTGLHAMAVAKDGEKIYMSGGCGGAFGGHRTRTQAYLVDINEWVDLPPMRGPCSDHSMSLHEGVLYNFGGRFESPCGLPVTRLDPRATKWVTITAQQEYIYGVSSCSFKNGVLVAGGTDGRNSTNVVKLFDPRMNSFITLQSLVNPIEFGSLITHGNLAYLFGYGNFEEQENNSAFGLQFYSSGFNEWISLPETFPLEAPIFAS